MGAIEAMKFCALVSLGLTGVCMFLLPLLDRPRGEELPGEPEAEDKPWRPRPSRW